MTHEEEHGETINKTVKDTHMSTNDSKVSQAQEKVNNAARTTNNQDMDLKENPDTKNPYEDSLPANDNEGSKLTPFRAYNKTFDIIWEYIFVSHDSFRQQLWNETDPSYRAMTITCNILEKEVNNPEEEHVESIISHELRTFLNDDAGNPKEKKLKLSKDTIQGVEEEHTEIADNIFHKVNPDRIWYNTETGSQESKTEADTPPPEVGRGHNVSESIVRGDS